MQRTLRCCVYNNGNSVRLRGKREFGVCSGLLSRERKKQMSTSPNCFCQIGSIQFLSDLMILKPSNVDVACPSKKIERIRCGYYLLRRFGYYLSRRFIARGLFQKLQDGLPFVLLWTLQSGLQLPSESPLKISQSPSVETVPNRNQACRSPCTMPSCYIHLSSLVLNSASDTR